MVINLELKHTTFHGTIANGTSNVYRRCFVKGAV
jgi:hypothetical protein